LAKKIQTARTVNKTAHRLIIKPERAGLQISEIQIPLSAYDRAIKYKDENELFYSTIFKVSKYPRLVSPDNYYSIDIDLKADQKILEISSKHYLTSSLNSDIGFEYGNSKLEISRLNMGFKQLSRQKFLNSYQFGRFTPSNTGILINTSKLTKSDSLINAIAFISLKPECEDCMLNALTLGYEQYSQKLEGYARLNLLFSNFKQRTDTTFELVIQKQLNNKNKLIISAQYEVDTKNPNVFAKLVFPLNSNQGIGSIAYTPVKKEFISNWVDNTSNALLENTPSFLKRNWNSYFNF